MTVGSAEDDDHVDPDADGVHNEITGGVFFQPVVQGRDITVHLPPRIEPALSGLPRLSPAFTGRDTDIAELLEVLAPARNEPHAVSVTAVAGLAGIGKTELVVQAAARARKRPGWFPGGVLFTNLFGYDPERRVPPEQALDGWLRALGIPAEHIPTELEGRSRQFRSVLEAYASAGRRILLVIDNASSAAQAEPLLPTDDVTAALVTSRHDLALDAHRRKLDVLPDTESVGLLRRSLLVARSGDKRVDDEPDAARAIAALCAGLPIALCIAAALLADIPTRPLSSLAQALTAEHTRLNRLRREERAVRAAFDLSYRHLGPDHARLFRLLPVNAGPDISTESATHLANIAVTDTTPHDTESLLQDLARSHLIEPGTLWDRWRMHDLVRLYADEHGRTHAHTDGRLHARTRLHDHYRTTAQSADTHFNTVPGTADPRFPDRDHALTWLDGERANLIATSVATAPLGHPETTADLALSLARHLNHRRLFDDLITVTTAALEVLSRSADRDREGRAWNNLGVALAEVRRFDEAIDAHTTAAAVFRDLGDRHSEGTAWNNLGVALQQVRRFQEAVDAHATAAAVFRDFGDRHGEGGAWSNLGLTLWHVGRFHEAVDAHTTATTIFRDLGDRHSEGSALDNLGLTLRHVRRFDEAIGVHTTAVGIHRDLGDRHGESRSWRNLGLALRETRRLDEAVDAHRQDLRICRDLGDRHGEAGALNNLGLALHAGWRLDDAIDAHTTAAAIHRDLGDRHGESGAWSNLGLALQQADRFDEAIDAHTNAATVFRELGDHRGESRALTSLGLALQQADRFGEAVGAHTAAAAVHRRLGDQYGEAGAWNNLGIALRHLRRFDDAIDAHIAAAAIYRDLDDGPAERNTLMAWITANRERRGRRPTADPRSVDPRPTVT